ncbi:MAG: hypothetical protein ABI406_02590, partial [Ktedonobacteraceae bacterium]
KSFMFKHYLRWIAPLIVLVVLVTYLALATLISTHAAAPTVHTQSPSHVVAQPHNVTPHEVTPSIIRRGF